MKFLRAVVISRPLFWMITMFSFLLGMNVWTNFNLITIFEFLMFTFPLNFYLYGLNDAYDLKSDKINPNKGDIQGAVITSKEAKFLKKATFIPAIIFLMISLLSFNAIHFLLSLVFVFFCFAYSHPSIRMRDMPFIDCFASMIIYYSPAFIAYSSHSSINSINPLYLLLLLPFLGIHALTTLRDYDYDKAAGFTTTGVFLGHVKTILFLFITILIPAFFFYTNTLLLAAFVLGSIMSVVMLFPATRKPEFVFSAGVTFLVLATFLGVYHILLVNQSLFL